MHRIPLAAALAALALTTGSAHAQSYAALDEEPVASGELRLIAPIPAPPGAPTLTSGEALGFPLKHTDVDVQVDGVMAEVVVEQTFANPYDTALDAVYVFPLGPDAAVGGYEFEIGERRIVGQIAERQEARRRYEDARTSGHTAGLLQQEKPNVFTQEIANLPPGESITVRFTYVELVDHWDGQFELVFPMVVGPRFLPGQHGDARPVVGLPAGVAAPAGVTGVPFLAPGQRSGHDIDLHVTLDAGVPLQGFASTTHALVDGGVEGTAQLLDLDPSDRLPNKDFVLRWSTAGERTLATTLAHRDDDGGFVSLVLHPKAQYGAGDLAPREVIVLMDRSGSMSGAPLAGAKDVAHELLGALRPGDSFNVLAFSDAVDRFSAGAVPADAGSVAAARDWVARVSSGGGTQMLGGLREATTAPIEEERIRVVYLLSDGEVGNDDDILASLDRRGALRVYPVGIGSSPNRYLFDRTAERARGFATYLGPNDDAVATVRSLVRRSTAPYLTDIEIDWGGLAVHSPTPATLPDLHAGEPLVLSARYDRPGTGTVVLRARRGGVPIELPLEVTLPRRAHRPGVAHLWARRRIHELKTEALGQPGRSEQKEITKIGLRFGLVTDYTSYVAVDESRVVDRTDVRRVDQAVELPQDMQWKGVFGGLGIAPRSAPGATPTNAPASAPGSTPASAPARSTPAPSHAPARPPASAPPRKRQGGSYGGGALDPLSGALMLGLAGLVARRRKD